MCTASIIPIVDAANRDQPARVIGVRLITNRDELRVRPEALPPAWFAPSHAPSPADAPARRTDAPASARRAVYPVDPVGGGTWVAATTGGLALCLLNANPPGWSTPSDPARAGLISRGAIIPGLLDAPTARDAASRVPALALNRFAPFTLLAADLSLRPASATATNPPHRTHADHPAAASRVWRAVWDGRSILVDELGVAPVCVASSGLGDHLVTPRLPLFDSIVRAAEPGPSQAEAQDRFHRHRWPGRPEISVLMSRREARTVSITTVELLADPAGAGATVTMVYETIHDPRAAVHVEPAGLPARIRHHAPVVATGAA